MTQASLDANDRDIWEWLALRAEVRLQAQLSAAIAADQRAMVWSGLLAAAAAALASAASVCLTSSPPKIGLGYTAVVGCGGLLIGLLFAVLAARPSRWFYPGSLPSAWISDIRTHKPQAQAMQEFCDDLSDMICKNERLMADNGKMLMLSVYLTVATLFGCVISIGKITFGA
ncbi:hypothetical protein KZ810_07955 [Sphingomonas sp. RHCKR47]|uniref:hypothetical protein n=1 Tax=Sphingomonas citricola TaxID=2862498 RepID=UPI001CA4B7AA|nr:hypothetical protein [Sphingomonas citricola]MBW6523430.1 hypothetical protein [Sphingomonas citricola]